MTFLCAGSVRGEQGFSILVVADEVKVDIAGSKQQALVSGFKHGEMKAERALFPESPCHLRWKAVQIPVDCQMPT